MTMAAKPILDKIERTISDSTIGRHDLLDALEEVRDALDARIDALRLELDDEEAD